MKTEDKANAALIVQAVNSYDALLAVARAAEAARAEMADARYGSYSLRYKPVMNLDKALAALDKLTKVSVDKKQSTE